MPHDVEHLYLTDPIADLGRIDGIMFSGGVGEYIYQREDRDFGDMGPLLGRAIRARIEAGAFPWPVLPAGECIRATALGASEYSVQLSGNTSYISAPGTLLPRRNLQVLQPPFECGESIDSQKLADAIATTSWRSICKPATARSRSRLRWTGMPAHERLLAFAEGIKHGLADRIAKKEPVFIMLDGDVAQTLGHILRDELNVDSELAGYRRRGVMGFRLYRSRPHPHAVIHCAGDHQIAGVQRGSARSAPASAAASSRSMIMSTRMIMIMHHHHGDHHHHDHDDHEHDHLHGHATPTQR